MTNEEPTLERVCGNCQASHPSEPFESEFAICLNDPDLAPYLDDILDRQDFSRCEDLVRRRRFAWDHDACERFDPVEDVPEAETPVEVTDQLLRLARAGKLTRESFEQALLLDAVNRIDWAKRPVEDDLRDLAETTSLHDRHKIVRRFGILIGHGNRPAFDGLCRYLRGRPPPASVSEKELRIEILRQLSSTQDPAWLSELARLLIDDLFRTPSTNLTRGWYSEVFSFFGGRRLPETARRELARLLAAPQFSSRVKRRVREVFARRP